MSDRAPTLNAQPFRITGFLSASVAAVTVTALVVMWGMTSVFSSMFRGVGDESEPTAELASLVSEHEAAMSAAQDRFNGRSIFFAPKPRLEPKTKHDEQVTITTKQDVPDPVLIYAGPSPIYAIGDTVWFKSPRQGDPQLVLNVGEFGSDEVTLISTSLPWSIKVRWKGHEFDLKLFENKGEPFLRDGAPKWPTHPGVMPKYDDPFMTPLDSVQPRQYLSRDQFPGDVA